ncbi:uncharacterized protein [Anabrus simplex]|uniref:uncharacterized protein n=1 Tax=Anabrus simplex TaxID=316456 RepID=UPI0034DD2338
MAHFKENDNLELMTEDSTFIMPTDQTRNQVTIQMESEDEKTDIGTGEASTMNNTTEEVGQTIQKKTHCMTARQVKDLLILGCVISFGLLTCYFAQCIIYHFMD